MVNKFTNKISLKSKHTSFIAVVYLAKKLKYVGLIFFKIHFYVYTEPLKGIKMLKDLHNYNALVSLDGSFRVSICLY